MPGIVQRNWITHTMLVRPITLEEYGNRKEKKKCNYHIIQQLYSWALILETGRLNAHTKTST